MGSNKTRRMVGGARTPRLPRASRRREEPVNIENIQGESMGEAVPPGRTPIRLMYDDDVGAPGYLRIPPVVNIENIENVHGKSMAKRVRPGKTPIRLMYDEPAAAPGPAAPQYIPPGRFVPATLFNPSRIPHEEMWGGGRNMVGGTTTPIIPAFPSAMAAATPPSPAFSPPRPLARAALPAAVHAAPYSHEAIRRGLAPETPAPGQTWEDLYNQRVAQELQRQAMPVFGAPPPSPASPASAFATPLNARQVRGARSAYAALSPSANHSSPLRMGPLFEEGEHTAANEMEGGVRRRRGTKKRGAIRRRFLGQRGGWPWSCTGSKCTAAVAPAPLTPEQMNSIQYKPGGMGRGWRCPLCDVISPVLEYTDRYVRGSRENNEDGYYAYTCPACQGEIPSREENVRIQEAEANVERLVGEEQVTASAEDLRRTARELGNSEENIESNIRRIREPNTRTIDEFLHNNQVGGGRRRGTKKRGMKRKALRRTLHRLRGGWPSWLRNPFSGCMDGKCDAAVAPAPIGPAPTPTAEDAEIAEIRERLAAAAAEESAAAQRGMDEFRAKMALEAEVEAQVKKFGEEGAGEYGGLILSLNNAIYSNIQRLIQMNETKSIQVYRSIQLNLFGLVKLINNIYIICKNEENDNVLKGFLMKRVNMQSNLRFILQLLALYQENRRISTDVEEYLHDNENVMLILEEMREAVKMVCTKPVVVSGQKISLIQYVKAMSANTVLTNDIQRAITQLMYVMTFMMPQKREAWGAADK